MRRGILVLNSDELIELGRASSLDKIEIALEDLKEENRILTNEEELENILDEIGMPESNEILISALQKMSDLLRSLREN